MMSGYCKTCTVFNAQETSALMQGYNCTVVHAFKAEVLISGHCLTVVKAYEGLKYCGEGGGEGQISSRHITS